MTYHNPHHIQIKNIPDPNIKQTNNIILHITTTTIYNSNLHLYRNKIPQIKHNDIFNHKFIKKIIETKKNIKNLQKNDQIIIPFIITYNDYFFYRLQQYTTYENTNTNKNTTLNKKQIPTPTTLFNYNHLYNDIPNKQTKYIHIPKKNIKPFKIPPLLSNNKTLFLSNILPTT